MIPFDCNQSVRDLFTDKFAKNFKGLKIMLKRKFLTLEERMKIIKLSDKGKRQRWIAEELKVGKTQIQSTLKHKLDIIKEYENNVKSDSMRICVSTIYNVVNDLCLKWFNNATSRMISVSGA
ncbi:hypothetical protein ACF0H5_020815 [Mactra antiquata]